LRSCEIVFGFGKISAKITQKLMLAKVGSWLGVIKQKKTGDILRIAPCSLLFVNDIYRTV
jgi:hypothetical protein